MSGEVIPLRRTALAPSQCDGTELVGRVFPRKITYPSGMNMEAVRQACAEQSRLLDRYEGRLTAVLAKALADGLPPTEAWVGVIIGPDADAPDYLVELGPREQAVQATAVWPSISRALEDHPPPERLDVVVESDGVVSLLSVEATPTLPVTRGQAEAMDLPAHLLFARGEAFASVREEPTTVEGLLAAWTEHRKLVDERIDDVLEDLRKTLASHPLADCAGVVLSLGEEGRAVTAVTRAQASKVLAHHPILARRLEGKGRVRQTRAPPKTHEEMALPIVVWAKGHISVQWRDVVTSE
jgi:hypothetical protein